MSFPKIIAKLSYYSFRINEKIARLNDNILTGFWLGVMGDKSLDASDDLYYHIRKQYVNEEYNMSGLFNWEKEMIRKHFSPVKSILLIAAGGGRELIQLLKMGFDVDSYECNPYLVDFGNSLLKKQNYVNRIKVIPRNSVPKTDKQYDGMIIGWGAYTLIRGSQRRKLFINELKPLLKEQSPLMISFLTRKRTTRQDKIIAFWANCLKFSKEENKIQYGDYLIHNYAHFFTKDEIIEEITSNMYEVKDYYDQEYGCLIAEKKQ